MKKLLCTLTAAICAFCCLLGLTACGEKHEHSYGHVGVCECGEKQPPSAEVQYALSDDGTYAYVSGWKANEDTYTSKNSATIIAEEYEGKPVTEIRGMHKDVTSIVIPKSVTTIADNAFYEKWNLLYVTFSEGLQTIGKKAFYGCYSGSVGGIKAVTIPDSVTSIGDEAFANCNDLATVILPCGITEIGDKVFNRCSAALKIYFKGAESDIENISGYAKLLPYAQNSYFYSETAPADEGYFWHYGEDGVTPVVW